MTKKKSDRPQNTETAAFNTYRHPNMLLNLTPRQSRVIDALSSTIDWISREAIDRIAGASNGPEVIRQLRKRLGHDAIAMEKMEVTDRDGRPAKPGQYRLTPKGRQRLAEMGVM